MWLCDLRVQIKSMSFTSCCCATVICCTTSTGFNCLFCPILERKSTRCLWPSVMSHQLNPDLHSISLSPMYQTPWSSLLHQPLSTNRYWDEGEQLHPKQTAIVWTYTSNRICTCTLVHVNDMVYLDIRTNCDMAGSNFTTNGTFRYRRDIGKCLQKNKQWQTHNYTVLI